jgi:L-cysteine/cystine lyase
MEEQLAQIRSQLPALTAGTYLNTGTAGPLALATQKAILAGLEKELASGRAEIGGFLEMMSALADLRTELAQVLAASPEEIALTHNTTEGMNIATFGLDYRPGDEVVTTSIEHEGGLLPLYQLHHRQGVKVKFAQVGLGEPQAVLDALAQTITTKTRLVVVSHVSYSTGAALPLTEIVNLAHSRGALVLADGAQSVGAIPLDLPASGVDFYAFPGHKWLMGPEGTGGLYVRRDRIAELEPTFIGFFGIDPASYRADDPQGYTLAAGAQRYEVGTIFRPGIAGFLAGLRWLHQEVGFELIYSRIKNLAEFTLPRIAELPGAQVLTPASAHAGLINFHLAGQEPAAVVEAMKQAGHIIRYVPDNGSLRISTGFYNTESEIESCLADLEKLLG